MELAFFIVLGITVVLFARREWEFRVQHWPHGMISYAGAAAIVTSGITIILGVVWAVMAGLGS